MLREIANRRQHIEQNTVSDLWLLKVLHNCFFFFFIHNLILSASLFSSLSCLSCFTLSVSSFLPLPFCSFSSCYHNFLDFFLPSPVNLVSSSFSFSICLIHLHLLILLLLSHSRTTVGVCL